MRPARRRASSGPASERAPRCHRVLQAFEIRLPAEQSRPPASATAMPRRVTEQKRVLRESDSIGSWARMAWMALAELENNHSARCAACRRSRPLETNRRYGARQPASRRCALSCLVRHVITPAYTHATAPPPGDGLMSSLGNRGEARGLAHPRFKPSLVIPWLPPDDMHRCKPATKITISASARGIEPPTWVRPSCGAREGPCFWG